MFERWILTLVGLQTLGAAITFGVWVLAFDLHSAAWAALALWCGALMSAVIVKIVEANMSENPSLSTSAASSE